MKKHLQTSLRIIKCQLCDNYVLLDDMIDHIKSNCRNHIMGGNSLTENESPFKENKDNLISFLQRPGSKDLRAYSMMDI